MLGGKGKPEENRKRRRNNDLTALHVVRNQLSLSEYCPDEYIEIDVVQEPSVGSSICNTGDQCSVEIAAPTCNMGDVDEERPMEIAASADSPKDIAALTTNMGDVDEDPSVSLISREEDAPVFHPWDVDNESDDAGWMELKMQKTQQELEDLHIASFEKIYEFDPKKNDTVPTRFCEFNLACFDLDKESKVTLGPPPEDLSHSVGSDRATRSINVISLRVRESDRDYPISIFGTVLARDKIDYRCVYLFKRDREDPQVINKPGDMLTLTGPRRALVLLDHLWFEFNLKIKGDPDEDFSKGVIVKTSCIDSAITMPITSWLSTMELTFAAVNFPVAANLKVKILKGPPNAPFNGKVFAGPTGSAETQMMILYDNRLMHSGTTLIGEGGFVVLSRDLVAIHTPTYYDDEEDKLVAYVRFIDHEDDEDDDDVGTWVDLEYPDQEHVCTHGLYELQVKVTWSTILESPMARLTYDRRKFVPELYRCLDYQNY